ncbi:uncharacterized protein LOC105254949 [Camponotus floridanus]|uniref:uncharacterized protein LOC105254949 n=1 Tax=Camponotus floridanus TaxID=104421 RepID=UPI00059E5E0D|nr:uncharacterized protein LOC105254949 [Camponotus floridanus]
MNIYITLHLFAIFLSNVHSKPNNQQLISKISNYIVEPSGIFVNDLNNLRLQVQNAINNVEDIIQQFKRVRTEIEEDTYRTVLQKWWDQMDNFKDYVNLVVVSMQREVNTAKMQGKDAQYCYDANFCAITEHSNIAYEAATKCEDSATNSTKKNLEFVSSYISFGETLITELNDLFLNCHDSDNTKMQACILTELGTINNDVKNFKENVKYLRTIASPISDSVILQAKKCLKNAYLWAQIETKNAMSSNSRCVQDALKNKKNMIKKLAVTCKLRFTFIFKVLLEKKRKRE